MEITPAYLLVDSQTTTVSLSLSALTDTEMSLIEQGNIEIKPFVYDKGMGRFIPIYKTAGDFSVELLKINKKGTNLNLVIRIKGVDSVKIFGIGVGIRKSFNRIAADSYVIVPVLNKSSASFSVSTKVILEKIQCSPQFWFLFPPPKIRCSIKLQNSDETVANIYLVSKLGKTALGLYNVGVLFPEQQKQFEFVIHPPKNVELGVNKLYLETKVYGLINKGRFLATNSSLIVFYFPWYIVVIALTLLWLLHKLIYKRDGKYQGKNTHLKKTKESKTNK